MTDTIGQQLKQERERRNLTLEKVVSAIHIRARFLEAIEEDRLDDLPSPQAGQGFLRLYADYLGLNPVPLKTKPSADAPPGIESVEIEIQEIEIEEPRSDITEDQVDETIEPDASPEDLTQAEEIAKEPDTRVETSSEPSLSDTIFKSIGEQLRRQREILGFSFNEVERHIFVRRHYLEALENGDFTHLPSSVQARGMLSNYARFLDMDSDAILLTFADGLQARLREKQPAPALQDNEQKEHKAFPKGLRMLFSFDVIFGGGLIILLVTFAIWGTSQVLANQRIPSNAPTLSISAALLETHLPENEIAPTATPLINSVPISTANGEILPQPTPLQGRIQVVATILERTWLRVTVDGKVEFDGRALPGATYAYGGNQRIEVLTGNGAAVQITYNLSDMGVMGSFGEIVTRIYTDTGVEVPTPTITTTPTQTKPATPAPARTTSPAELP